MSDRYGDNSLHQLPYKNASELKKTKSSSKQDRNGLKDWIPVDICKGIV